MGSLDFDFCDDILDLLDSISDNDDLVIDCLESVRDITAQYVAKELHKYDNTGDMANSVKCSSPSANKSGDGYHIFASPTGYSSHTYNRKGKGNVNKRYKVSNGLKAVWLEYGNVHQSAKPWLVTAKKNAEDEVIDKMQSIINERIGDT